MLVNVFNGSWNGGYLVDGGRNLILNSKGDTKSGFFKYFNTVTDEYAEFTLKSKKTIRYRIPYWWVFIRRERLYCWQNIYLVI